MPITAHCTPWVCLCHPGGVYAFNASLCSQSLRSDNFTYMQRWHVPVTYILVVYLGFPGSCLENLCHSCFSL